MTFEETKNALKEKESILTDLYPTLGFKQILNTAFDLIESALNEESREISQKERDEINCLLDFTLVALIESETSREEIETILLIADIFQNLGAAYPDIYKRPWDIRILNSLIGAKRALDDSILLCTYLAKRVKGVFTEEDSTSFLSRKFYTEYNNFLKGKTHDDSYSVNK